MPFLYPLGAREEVNDSEVNELFQKVRKLNNKYTMEECTRITGLIRKRTSSLYAFWFNLYGGEYDLAKPLANKSGYVSKEIMISFLNGMLETEAYCKLQK